MQASDIEKHIGNYEVPMEDIEMLEEEKDDGENDNDDDDS